MNLMDKGFMLINKAAGAWGLPLVTLAVCLLFISLVLIVGMLSHALVRMEYGVISSFLGSSFAMFFINYLTFPGTVNHEWSHAVFAILTGAKVTKIKCFEKPSSGQLGHIEFIPRGIFITKAIQMSVTSCAPAVTGILFTFVLIRGLMFNPNGSYTKGILLYLLFCVINHSQMSSLDVRNYFKGMIFIFPIIYLIAYFILKFMGVAG
jgi:hypothetical protein